jgi:UDP-2,3-diacylglucosamine pyrophosphatase LpxH
MNSSNRTRHLVSARTVWISDTHLGFRDCKVDYLLAFLENLHCETLYLVGDIIDLWSLKKRFCWPKKHYQVILKIFELANKGVRVIYVPGNHDDPVRHFNKQFFGAIEITQEHEHVTVDGKRLLIMHGDAMDAYINHSWIKKIVGDHAYDFLLFINRWSNHFRRWFGRPYFSLAGLIKSNIKGAQDAIKTYEEEAINEAKRRGFDGVVCGHIHYPRLCQDNHFHYANCGDWIENCTAITEDFQGALRLLHFSDAVYWSDSVSWKESLAWQEQYNSRKRKTATA